MRAAVIVNRISRICDKFRHEDASSAVCGVCGFGGDSDLGLRGGCLLEVRVEGGGVSRS